MRDSLKKSLADSPVKGFERFPKGSIVVCTSCAAPIFKLDHGISLGDKAGKMASAFKPITLADLETLAGREDIDAGIRATLRSWTPDQCKAHIASLREVKTGDPMLCPICDKVFVQVLAEEKNEALDRSYTLELLTIPPVGVAPVALKGKHLGYGKDWVH